MALLAAVPGLGLVLVNDDLAILVVGLDLGDDAGALHGGDAEAHLAVPGDGEDLVQHRGAALLGFQQLDVEHIAGGDAVLLAAGFNDCVIHFGNLPNGLLL